MKTSKDIDFSNVVGISYSIEDYYADIPITLLAAHYIKNYHPYDGVFRAMINGIKVSVNSKTNECFFDYEKVDPEEFVYFFEGEKQDAAPKIKEITGIDLDDYIDCVTYSDGTKEELITLKKARCSHAR